MSLALATLLYEWRRYSAAVMALAFAGLLILAQVGMFTGIVRGITATLDRSRADLIVLPFKNESLLDNGDDSLPARIQPLMYLNPNVAEVGSWGGNGGRWMNIPKKGQKQVQNWIQIFTIDTKPGSVALPTDFSERTREALMEPGAVAIDRTTLGRLGVKPGDTATINGKTVHVRAVLTGYPSVNQPQVFMSRDSLRFLGMGGDLSKTGPLLVRLRNPALALTVRDQLNAVSQGAYKVWMRPDLAKANEKSIMKEQIIGMFIGSSLVIGLIIGVGITSQTLRGAVVSSIKEFASLRALGVSMGSLRLIVMELALWIGVAGLLATGIIVWALAAATASVVAMGFPMGWIIGVTVLLLGIAALSGIFSLGVLKKSQPADLLR